MPLHTMTQRSDVRAELLALGWVETEPGLMRKNGVAASYNGPDVFVTGPARIARRAAATTSFPSSVPSAVIVAACESWAT